jgi:glucose-6-phosphate-specific signal transduction histidine kinase
VCSDVTWKIRAFQHGPQPLLPNVLPSGSVTEPLKEQSSPPPKFQYEPEPGPHTGALPVPPPAPAVLGFEITVPDRQKGGAPEPKALALIESVALRAVENCRGIARGLSARAETGGDLYGAFRRLPDRFRHRGPPVIVVTIEGSAPLALPEGAQDHIYRIVQEAITNAVKHADSERIDVVLKTAPDAIRLTVQDDGRGLPADFARRGGLGLASMHYRASAIGAQLYVTNSLGGGTEVRLEYGI